MQCGRMIATIDEPGLPGKIAALVILVPRFRLHQDGDDRNERRSHWGGVVFRKLKQWSAGGQTVFLVVVARRSGNNDRQQGQWI